MALARGITGGMNGRPFSGGVAAGPHGEKAGVGPAEPIRLMDARVRSEHLPVC